MPVMTKDQFGTFKLSIKNAKSFEDFTQLFIDITSFTPNNNMYSLGLYFNTIVKTKFPSFNSLFDPDHILMLIKLHEAASAVRQHIAYIGCTFFGLDPLSFTKHVYELDEMIEARKGGVNYLYYCQYFNDEIYKHLLQHHPKIQHNKPYCVAGLDEVSNENDLGFS